jgi:hypothetical protein
MRFGYVISGKSNSGKYAFGEMVRREMVHREMKYGESVRGETVSGSRTIPIFGTLNVKRSKIEVKRLLKDTLIMNAAQFRNRLRYLS